MLDDLNGSPIAGTITGPAVRPGDLELPAQRDCGPPAQQLQEFGRRVQRVRRRREWSLRELEKRSGVDRGLLSRVEGGKNITLDVLWRLANGLGVHWADLLDDRTTEPPNHRRSASFERQLFAFGALLNEARLRQHLSQPELVTRTGVSRSTLFAIEGGSGNVRLDTVLRLAAGLGVHAADLLDDRHAASPRPKSRLHEALAEVSQLRTELEQARTQLSLAQARVAVAERVAEDKAATRLTNAAAQARLVVDSVDRPRLAVLSPQADRGSPGCPAHALRLPRPDVARRTAPGPRPTCRVVHPHRPPRSGPVPHVYRARRADAPQLATMPRIPAPGGSP